MSICREDIEAFAERIGKDPLLVQGAGGNLSWKDGDTLWIKASGTWLEEARQRDIFVPVGRQRVCTLIEEGADDFSGASLDARLGRPSIETSFHALLPHAIVAHVHAVEAIAAVVDDKRRAQLPVLLQGLSWTLVDYAKPGKELTTLLAHALAQTPDADVFLLANHGLIVGGQSIQQVEDLLAQVSHRLAKPVRRSLLPVDLYFPLQSLFEEAGYSAAVPAEWQRLATDPLSCSLVRERWVLYPDHAVFLGATARVLEPGFTPEQALSAIRDKPACIFIAGVCLLLHNDMQSGARAMLGCYHDVVMRLDDVSTTSQLSEKQIAVLLNWDAEKYRQTIAR